MNHLYLTEYCVPQNFDFPDDFRVDTRPGMLFYQVIDKNARERRVIAWWKSREAFEAWGKQFGRLLGAHEVLVSKEVDTRFPSPGNRKPAFLFRSATFLP